MPPPAILEPQSLNLANVVADRQAIQRCNPQAFEFALLDAVVLFDSQTGLFAGYHDLPADPWWARGHVPGRPLFPGILMIECAAQLASYAAHRFIPDLGFMGFGGIDEVKFRGAVEPPARFLVISKATETKRRRFVCQSQGFVANQMVFEGIITGMPV